jgi:hypothetical protein
MRNTSVFEIKKGFEWNDLEGTRRFDGADEYGGYTVSTMYDVLDENDEPTGEEYVFDTHVFTESEMKRSLKDTNKGVTVEKIIVVD